MNIERMNIIKKLYNKGYSLKEIELNLIKKGYTVHKNSIRYIINKLKGLNEDIDLIKIEKNNEKQKKQIQYQKKVNKELLKKQIVEDEIEERLLNIIRKEIKPIKPVISKKNNTNCKLYHFTDIHIGKKGTIIKQNNEQYTIVERLNVLFNDILESKEDIIYLVNTGDLFETLVQDGMHNGQKNSMDIRNGDDILMYTFNLFIGLYDKLASKNKKVISLFIGGNHDRISKKNEDDNGRLGMFMFVMMLKQRYINNKKFTFEIDSKVNRYYYEDFNYSLLISHGEDGFNNVKVQDYKIKYNINTNKHLIVLSGHWHQLGISNGYNTTKIISPGLAGIGEYDYKLGLNSNTGYTVITNNNGIPNIHIKYID